jgi:DNA-binding NarL/FixJ family response regulator
MHPEERFALRVLRAGASGYLTKESVGSDIVAAIRKVTSGRKYVSDSLLTDLVDELDHRRSKSLHDRLSNREYEIFLKIAAGKSTSQIAEALSLSINTIATYRSRILEKMKLKSNVELVRYAIEKKLLD